MFRKISWITLVILLVASMSLSACAQATPQPAAATQPPAAATQAQSSAGQAVTLTLGNWRPDDAKQMAVILDEFHKAYPNITIKFDPINPPDYDAAVRTQMEAGSGDDLYYLRAAGSGASHKLYDEGHFLAIDKLKGLDNIIPDAIQNWTAKDGHIFGVGYIATSEGIYYNKDVFTKLNLAIPTTWEDLMAVAQKIKDAGYIPFANASGEAWTIGTLLMQDWIPTDVGGATGREAYFKGDKCLNDANFLQAFQQAKDMAPFLPAGQAALTNADTQQLWLQGKAIMFLDGSWDIPVFESQKPSFQWDIMYTPAPKGKDQYVEYEFDAGVGINAATKHPDEAKTFLSWLTTKQSAELLSNNLPGFYPMTKDTIDLKDPYAAKFLTLKSAAKGADIRFYMTQGTPDSTSMFDDLGIAVINGSTTPQDAAQKLYDGIASWSDAQKNCKK
jgi:raffinose/stachyose/melibiose transport system substrate-binding protein